MFFSSFVAILLRVSVVAALSVVLAVSTGCGKKITRIESNEITDLSGKWNDTDSRLVSREMIDDVLSRPWISNFNRKKSKVPVVIVGAVRNLSHEHINTRTFISDLERELINSGEVQFVASASEREEVRDERRDQDLNASESTRKAMGHESGADFMLKGTINTIVDAAGGDQARFYQVDLTLIDLLSNRKVWVGQKKIKKKVEKNSWRL
ncbi:putative lipoprotein [hydrothermal vent metagenome]|uniref:Putative lipoprotein n=1 Tax=hydrothermal vent metagenome TaxID=652676 RepID=A0A3B0XLM3_9ZZZZ